VFRQPIYLLSAQLGGGLGTAAAFIGHRDGMARFPSPTRRAMLPMRRRIRTCSPITSTKPGTLYALPPTTAGTNPVRLVFGVIQRAGNSHFVNSL